MKKIWVFGDSILRGVVWSESAGRYINSDKIGEKEIACRYGMEITNRSRFGCTLPKGTKIRLYVGDKYEDGNFVNIYYYNNNKLELVNNGTIVKEEFIEIEVDKGGEFFITKSNINNVEKNTIVYIVNSFPELAEQYIEFLSTRLPISAVSNTDFKSP